MTATVATTSSDRERGLVAAAIVTIGRVRAEYPTFERRLGSAEAVLVVPALVGAGFAAPGEATPAVLTMRGPAGWSTPLFYSLDVPPLAPQAGAGASPTILLVMSRPAAESLLAGSVTLGAPGLEIGLAGPEGLSVGRDDGVIAFVQRDGLGTVSGFDGLVLRPDGEANRSYHGRTGQPSDFIGSLGSLGPGGSQAGGLRDALGG